MGAGSQLRRELTRKLLSIASTPAIFLLMKKMSGVVAFALTGALALSLAACTPPTGTDINAIIEPTPTATPTPTPTEPVPVDTIEPPQWSENGSIDFVTLTPDEFIDFAERRLSEPNGTHTLLGGTPPGLPAAIPAPLGRWIEDSPRIDESDEGIEQYFVWFWMTAEEVDRLVAEFESQGWTVDADGETSRGRSIIMGSVTYTVVLEFLNEVPAADGEPAEDSRLRYTISLNETDTPADEEEGTNNS